MILLKQISLQIFKKLSIIILYHTIKAAFEKEDKNFSEKISKPAFYKVINMFTKDIKDEDIMKFERISGIVDT